MTQKTHFRKAFDSPYLSSQDLVEPTLLTIHHVALEPDRTHKTKEFFNTAYFVEKEIRAGEKLKPMVLNASNSKTLKTMTGSPYIEDWNNIRVKVYVDPAVKFGKDVVEGLRISEVTQKESLTPDHRDIWIRAKAVYLRDGNLDAVLDKRQMTDEHQKQLIDECKGEKK